MNFLKKYLYNFATFSILIALMLTPIAGIFVITAAVGMWLGMVAMWITFGFIMIAIAAFFITIEGYDE